MFTYLHIYRSATLNIINFMLKQLKCGLSLYSDASTSPYALRTGDVSVSATSRSIRSWGDINLGIGQSAVLSSSWSACYSRPIRIKGARHLGISPCVQSYVNSALSGSTLTVVYQAAAGSAVARPRWGAGRYRALV